MSIDVLDFEWFMEYLDHHRPFKSIAIKAQLFIASAVCTSWNYKTLHDNVKFSHAKVNVKIGRESRKESL